MKVFDLAAMLHHMFSN